MVDRADHNTATCPRCGLERRIKAERGAEYCVDCRSIVHPSRQLRRQLAHEIETNPENDIGEWVRHGLIWKWERPQPMPPADLVWAERQADRHFWDSWRRANRQDINPLQREAERRTPSTQRRKREAA